jgi:hypothetical protein
MDEETSPDEYFCEECRKDLHTIRGEPNGYVCKSLLAYFSLFDFFAPSPPHPVALQLLVLAQAG